MDWCESYNPNYFSIEDLLSTQERISCTFEVTLYGLGFLDPSAASEDLNSGAKLEIPCWMAQAFLTAKQKIASAQLPVTFRKSYREIFKADPLVVDLHKLGPYFYDVGLHLLPLAQNDSSSIASLLSQVFRERLRAIMDAALHSELDENTIQMHTMDELERSLFRIGQKCLRDHELWLSRKSHLLTASNFVESINKRKFSDIG